jgi:hypothetical protein
MAELTERDRLTVAQTRAAVSKLSLCQVTKANDWHAYIEADDPPRMGLSFLDTPWIVVWGCDSSGAMTLGLVLDRRDLIEHSCQIV